MNLPLSITDSGKLPNERFENHGQLTDCCNGMISADRLRGLRRSQIDGLHDGLPTYSLSRLRKRGQDWRARVNYQGLKGMCQTIETAIYNLDVEVEEACVSVDIDYGKGQEQADWEQCMSVNFTRMILNDWKDADIHIQSRIHDMVLHGMGYHVNTAKDQWIPRTLPSGNVLFPDECPLSFNEDGEYFMVRDYLSAIQLHSKIRNEKAAIVQGWNPKAVWKYLGQIGKGQSDKSVEATMKAFQAGDIGAAKQSGGWLNFLWVKEFDSENKQGISLYIVPEKGDVGDYLFKKRFYCEDWPLHIFPYDIGSRTIQSVRGAGDRMKDFFELQNRLFNAMADQVFVGSTMPVRQTGEAIDPEKLKLMKVGLFSIIPQGLEPVAWQAGQLQNGPIAFSRELKELMGENNQTYIPTEPGRQDRQTGMEYSMRSQNMSQISKGVHNLYYRNLSRFYDHILRVAAKKQTGSNLSAVLAGKFRDRCLRDGVPEEAFDHIENVTAVRSTGYGSAAIRLQALQTLIQFVYPNAAEAQKINLERDLTAALVGYAKVDRYARSADLGDVPTSDDSLAVVENDVLGNGGEALAASNQDHVRHAQRHLAKVDEIKQAVDGDQMDNGQAVKVVGNILQHLHDMQNSGKPGHLDYLSQNQTKQEAFAGLEKEFNSGMQFFTHIQALAEQQADSNSPQSPEQALSEEGKIKMAKVEQDGQIKKFKAQSDQQRKTQQFQFNHRLNDAKTAAAILQSNRPKAA